MKLLSKLFFCLVLAFFGCRQEKTTPQPTRTSSMKIGEIEIQPSIEKNVRPFSFQADLKLIIEIRNNSQSEKTVPFISSHQATFTLKEKKSGKETIVNYSAPKVPGTPTPPTHPDYISEAGEKTPFRILLQNIFGFITEGDYSLQYQIESPWLSFTTDWIDFSVLPQKIRTATIAPSSNEKAQRHLLVWNDLAKTPNRIMFQRLFTGTQRPLMPSTFAIAESDSPSTPIAITSWTEQHDNFEWVGWLSKNNLCLAKIYSEESVKNVSLPLPPKTNWSLLPHLNYANDVNGKNTELSGMLLGKDDSGLSLTAFILKEDLKPKWLNPIRLPSGKILAAKVTPLSAQSHLVVWVRSEADKLFVEALEWNDTLGFNKPILICGTINAKENSFKSLDVMVNAKTIKWGILLIDSPKSEQKSAPQLIEHSLNLKDYKTGPGAPKTTSFVGPVGPQTGLIKFDAKEQAWVLIHDVHGLWIKNKNLKEIAAIDCPPGFKNEELYFKNGLTPKILFLNPETGFESKGVALPDYEDSDESNNE